MEETDDEGYFVIDTVNLPDPVAKDEIHTTLKLNGESVNIKEPNAMYSQDIWLAESPKHQRNLSKLTDLTV